MTAGVYAIKNTTTGMLYVGATFGIESRWKAHQGLLRRGKHTNAALQLAWDLYGSSFFKL